MRFTQRFSLFATAGLLLGGLAWPFPERVPSGPSLVAQGPTLERVAPDRVTTCVSAVARVRSLPSRIVADATLSLRGRVLTTAGDPVG